MTEFANDSNDENSALRKRISELEGIVSELQKPTIRHEDRWLPRLTPILTILGGIQTLFIAAGVGFGLRIQPTLSESKKAQIRQHIAFCQSKIAERKKSLSKETEPLLDSNKLSLSILVALEEAGIFDRDQIEEIVKKSALENRSGK
jgi:hypothetical protein